jgi:cytochrome c-type biogenesis protein CcmF
MPWIVGTALLHSATVMEKRDALRSWTVLLAITAFAFSLLGTFLVRSGVLTSVHSFAVDPARGVFILALLIAVIGGGLTLYALRAPTLKGGGLFAPISREGALLLNNLILATAAATVFIGTLYPLVLEAAGGGKVSVGPPYYNATFVPLMAPLVAALGVGPLLAWKRGDLAAALGRLKFAAVAALVALVVTGAMTWGRPVLGAVAIGAAVWLAAGVLSELAGRIGLGTLTVGQSAARARGMPRSAWGMTLAHLGLAGVIAGAAGTALWTEEKILTMQPGQAAEIAGYDVRFEGAEERRGPNYASLFATFQASRAGEPVARLEAERRRYLVGGQDTTEAAIHTMVSGDLYAVIGEAQKNGGYVVRLYFKPLVAWIWAGAAIMVLGGLMSLSDRRLRIGAPARRKHGVATGAAPAE